MQEWHITSIASLRQKQTFILAKPKQQFDI